MPPTDRFVATAQFHVRYAETDAQGVVHHASYVVWLEEARLNYARARGRDYAEIERAGIFMSVIGVEIRYRAAAHFGDYITVHCWLDEVKSRTMAFGYEVMVDDTLCATARTDSICITREGKVTTWPKFMSEWYGSGV